MAPRLGLAAQHRRKVQLGEEKEGKRETRLSSLTLSVVPGLRSHTIIFVDRKKRRCFCMGAKSCLGRTGRSGLGRFCMQEKPCLGSGGTRQLLRFTPPSSQQRRNDGTGTRRVLRRRYRAHT